MPALNLSGARWHKSNRSFDTSNCVEVTVLDGTHWQKGSRSSDKANCVEVTFAGSVVALRDSKNPTGGVLAVPSPAWTAFTTAVRTGEWC